MANDGSMESGIHPEFPDWVNWDFCSDVRPGPNNLNAETSLLSAGERSFLRYGDACMEKADADPKPEERPLSIDNSQSREAQLTGLEQDTQMNMTAQHGYQINEYPNAEDDANYLPNGAEVDARFGATFPAIRSSITAIGTRGQASAWTSSANFLQDIYIPSQTRTYQPPTSPSPPTSIDQLPYNRQAPEKGIAINNPFMCQTLSTTNPSLNSYPAVLDNGNLRLSVIPVTLPSSHNACGGAPTTSPSNMDSGVGLSNPSRSSPQVALDIHAATTTTANSTNQTGTSSASSEATPCHPIQLCDPASARQVYTANDTGIAADDWTTVDQAANRSQDEDAASINLSSGMAGGSPITFDNQRPAGDESVGSDESNEKEETACNKGNTETIPPTRLQPNGSNNLLQNNPIDTAAVIPANAEQAETANVHPALQTHSAYPIKPHPIPDPDALGVNGSLHSLYHPDQENMASSGAQLPMTQGSDLDPPARKKKKDPLKEEKEAEYKRIRQSLVAKRLAVGNECALSTQFASLEEARQALRKSSPMIVQDSTIPTTTAEKQFYIRELIEAVHCNEIAGDNQRFAENWNGKYKSNEEIEAACWEVLEAAIEVTLKGRIHKEQLNKSSTYNCFIDRIAGIIHALKRNKTTCHNIMAPGHIQTLVHKPEAVMTRTESNRAGNANKARKLQDKAAKPNNIPAGDPSTISGNQSSANSTSQPMAPPAPRKSSARATRINRNKTVQNPHTRPNPQITQTRHTPQNNQISQIHHPPQNNPQMHHTLQNSWDPQMQHTLQNNQIFQMHRLPQNCLNPQIHHPLQNNQIPQVHHTPANACAASSYLSPGLSSQCSPLTQLQHGFDAGNAYTALGYHQQAQAPRQDGYQFVAVNPADADSNSFQSQQNGSKRGRQAKKRTHVEDNSERSRPNAKRRRC